jgi:hypothetical protein
VEVTTVFYIIIFSSSDIARCFGEIYCLRLQDRRVGQARNQQDLNLPPASTCFLLGFIFDPEDGGNNVTRNVRLSSN